MMTEIFLGKNGQREVVLKNEDSLCCRRCCSKLKNGKLDCNCGETDGGFQWYWDAACNGSSVMINCDREVLFHPVYSSGTAVVSGSAVFEKNFHYYFEVKILTSLYGTDVMVGVAKSDLDATQYKTKFCSLLGIDENSWGYSYSGCIQHNELKRKYGKPFGMGSLVGVHLDMCRGTLEYYLNRKPLGIAFRGLKNFELKPMVCSTAAQSCIRLTCSEKLSSSLQFEALMKIHTNPILTNRFLDVPGLRKLFNHNFFWMAPREPEYQGELELEDEVLLPLDNDGQMKRKKLNKWGVYVTIDDLRFVKDYPNKIVKRKNCKCSVPISQIKNDIKTNSKLIENIEAIRLDLNHRKEVVPKHFHHICSEVEEARKKRCKSQVEGAVKVDPCLNQEPSSSLENPLCEAQIYDLPVSPEPQRNCIQCSFKLGSHQECSNDPFCSFCDAII